jgi:hypothetical protein
MSEDGALVKDATARGDFVAAICLKTRRFESLST